jgi:uncharacterized protein YaaR (DUF327 family)
MAAIDSPELPSFYMNPAAFGAARNEEKKRSKGIKRSGGADFSRVFEEIQGKTAEALGPLPDLPVSGETVSLLMDEVHSAGDELRSRPFPEEIVRYKQAVRNFMHYVVKNSYKVDTSEGIPRFLRPNYRGQRGTPKSQERQPYITVQVVDRKLEELAAVLLSGQRQQLELSARLEEIHGLLIDLVL